MKIISMLTADIAKKVTNPAFLATTINTNISLEELAGGFIDLILNLALYGGAITAIGGAIAWGLAHKNGDSASQDKAVNAVLIGFIFMGFRGVLEIIGILK